jgi:dihydrofolate reductase
VYERTTAPRKGDVMGDVVVSEFISVDGVIEDPGGSEKTAAGGWAFRFNRGDEGDRFKYEELMAADAQLLGRVTYAGFAQAWPAMNGDEFGRKMNEMPKHVVSGSPLDPEWQNAHRLEGDLAGEVGALKEHYAGDILIAGSATLARSLGELGLVDEYRLMVYPVVLGSGRRLFEGASPHTLRLSGSRPAGDCLILTYVPAESA